MIKGLDELLKKHRETAEMTAEQFESDLNKLLPETWIPKTAYNELNEKYKLIEGQKAEADKLLKDATEAGKSAEKLKADYDKLVEAQKEAEKKYEADLLANKKAYALDLALTKAGAKNNKAVKALLDESKMTLDDKGELIGFKDQIEEVKKDNGFLFEIKQTTPEPQPKKPSFGGGNIGGSAGGTDEALRKAMGL